MKRLFTGRPLRYLIIGGWNTVFGLVFFTFLYLVLGHTLGYVAVLTIAQVVAVIQSHLTQRLFVWRSHAPYLGELARFSVVYVGVYVANLLLLVLSTDGLGLPVLPSQWVIGGALIVPTYFVQRNWAFRGHSVASPPSKVEG